MNTLVPLALADVTAILYCNAKMGHRISQIYGVWGTLLESWRLLYKVRAHLVATVAMAIGDESVEASFQNLHGVFENGWSTQP